MSLKSFHIILISVFLGFCSYLAYWLLKYRAYWSLQAGHAIPSGLMLGAIALALIVTVSYLGWFLKKSRLP